MRRMAKGAGWGLALLLATRLALGAAYSFTVPVWEADNEDGHFAYARYIALNGHLLDPNDPETNNVGERFQAPLYYVLLAPLLTFFDLGETFTLPERNPYIANGDAGLNYALHPPRLEGKAARLALAVRAARLASVLIGTLSVLFVYATARRVWPGQAGPVWAATSLYAFWPQFLFSTSMVTNDVLVITLSTGVFAVAVTMVTEGFKLRRALALTLLLTAAMLTKINALALLPVAVVAVALSLTPVLQHARWRSPRPWLALGALLGLVVAALALLNSFDFVTAQVLRVEVFTQFLFNLLGTQNSPDIVLEALLYNFRTYYVSFGWGNVETHPWLYQMWSAGFALAALGLVVGAARRRRGRLHGPDARLLLLMGLLIFSLLAAVLALVVAIDTIHLAPGRYLLPGLPAVSFLLVEGYRGLLPRRAQRHAWRALGLGAVLVGWAILFITILPTYAVPQPIARPPQRPSAHTFGNAIELIGYEEPAAVRSGQTAEATVCWRATAPVLQDYSVFLEVVGPDGQGYGRLVTYPGQGNFPTRYWSPGVPFCDRYRLPVSADMPAPALAHVRVALLSTLDPNGERLPVVAPDGQRAEQDAFVLPLKIKPSGRPAAPDQALDYRFGDELWLRGYSLAVEPATRSVRVTLQWQALRDLERDYVIFVHLRGDPLQAYAQADSEPRGGWYPTDLWKKGEVIEDVHVLTVPPGTSPPLELYVGVVHPPSETRLPAFDPARRELEHDEIILINTWVIDDRWVMPGSLKPPYEAP